MNQITIKNYELNMQNTKSFMHNKDMNSLISMTGKTARQGSKTGNVKNTQNKHEIIVTDATYLPGT